MNPTETQNSWIIVYYLSNNKNTLDLPFQYYILSVGIKTKRRKQHLLLQVQLHCVSVLFTTTWSCYPKYKQQKFQELFQDSCHFAYEYKWPPHSIQYVFMLEPLTWLHIGLNTTSVFSSLTSETVLRISAIMHTKYKVCCETRINN